jgi:hypothetical protein
VPKKSFFSLSAVCPALPLLLLFVAGCKDVSQSVVGAMKDDLGPSRYQSTIQGKWLDKETHIAQYRVLTLGNDRSATDVYYFENGASNCTIYANYRTYDDSNGASLDWTTTHVVGDCDGPGGINATSGTMRLDVPDANHILLGNSGLTRIKQ